MKFVGKRASLVAIRGTMSVLSRSSTDRASRETTRHRVRREKHRYVAFRQGEKRLKSQALSLTVRPGFPRVLSVRTADSGLRLQKEGRFGNPLRCRRMRGAESRGVPWKGGLRTRRELGETDGKSGDAAEGGKGCPKTHDAPSDREDQPFSALRKPSAERSMTASSTAKDRRM